jgi:hypothetical protein
LLVADDEASCSTTGRATPLFLRGDGVTGMDIREVIDRLDVLVGEYLEPSQFTVDTV